jgi:hypothetical protein
MKKKIAVIYVMGVFRSGSTVFDTLLGNLDEIESVGELVNVYQHAWLDGHYCACGKSGNECDVWVQVRDSLGLREQCDLEARILTQSKIERFRKWPLLLLQKVHKTEEFRRYSDSLVELYSAISEVTKKDVIVDSSKNPGRALALSMIDSIDLKVIHLVRDGRGVAWSCQKSFEVDREKGLQMNIQPVSTVGTTKRWMAINISSTVVDFLLGRKSIRVRYEDLVDEPSRTLTRIGGFLGIDTESLIKRVEEQSTVSVGHTIAGNRLRMGGAIKLKSDDEWKEKLPNSDRRAFWKMAGVLAKFYGYKEH